MHAEADRVPVAVGRGEPADQPRLAVVPAHRVAQRRLGRRPCPGGGGTRERGPRRSAQAHRSPGTIVRTTSRATYPAMLGFSFSRLTEYAYQAPP